MPLSNIVPLIDRAVCSRVESAADLQSAARALRARGLTPIVLKPAGSSALSAPAGGRAGSAGKGLSCRFRR